MNKPLAWSYSTWSAFQKCPKQYHEVRVLKSVSGDTFKSMAGDDQHKAFENAVKNKTPLPPNMVHHQPMLDQVHSMKGNKFAEMSLALNTTGQPCDYWAPNVWIRAKADVLIEQPQRITILDWKTGKSRYADTTQLKLTALIAFAKWPQVNAVRGALLFTAENKVIPAEYKRTEEKQYWQQMLVGYGDMMRAHESGNFVAKPSGLCKVCPVVSCPHNRKDQ